MSDLMPSLSRRVQVLFFVASGLVATGYVLVIYSTLRHSHDQVSLVERDAQSYLASLYETPPRFSCGHADTNGDGYISCTAVLDSGAPLAFECSPLLRLSLAQVAPILPYLLMVLILIFRPRGLLGTRDE